MGSWYCYQLMKESTTALKESQTYPLHNGVLLLCLIPLLLSIVPFGHVYFTMLSYLHQRLHTYISMLHGALKTTTLLGWLAVASSATLALFGWSQANTTDR